MAAFEIRTTAYDKYQSKEYNKYKSQTSVFSLRVCASMLWPLYFAVNKL